MYKLLVASTTLLVSLLCLPILPLVQGQSTQQVGSVTPIQASPSTNSPSMLPITDGEAYRSSHHAFAAPVILIDVGHGGVDGGTSAQGVLEKDINLAISQKVYLLLRSKGYAVIINRLGDYALSDDNRWLNSRSRHRRDLAQRKSLSEEVSTDIVVSIHANWSSRAATHGPVVLHQKEGRSYLLAQSIQDAMNDLYGTKRQVVWGKPFYLLNYVKHPAVIVETGFLSNATDRAKISDPAEQKRIAESIANGIIYYLSVV
ncbi:N-acetylmuramoyl-L-alanine amidase CwlD [Paenibacillus amylolyticus]|uniref:N-acetylmuramoyl-L-alanine amidase CwlD n=1 Tax=Paenibacillus amylolyticus TaxID=1451 RepID=A0AAP5GZ98_PAEAM|nr:N-acetylmuramoyl-L-alanine amidase [Paenibacillus amylolyticus]MDR6722470.1 N-acetylmuramoyl-L-alanine amidase CwlD [Paenibacillus amylolyticus]